MRQGQLSIGQGSEVHDGSVKSRNALQEDFVLEKSIFNNIFEKDIRRVFIYKKAERLAKALHLITPAFSESVSLRNRIDAVAIALVDAAVLPLNSGRVDLSRELLALSSLLSIARTGGFLSFMNADLISREAHTLLQEVAAYEEPRVSLDDMPTLADIAKSVPSQETRAYREQKEKNRPALATISKGHVKDREVISDIHIKDRRDSILSVIKGKGHTSIKDISTLIHDVSEKTIQRELSALISLGKVKKQGERRWSTYTLA